MKQFGRALLWLTLLAPIPGFTQIDPIKRDLIQLGYNQAFEGHAPFAGYAFFYHNQPDFLRTNLTLRLAVAPVYLDSEFGFVGGLGPHTDFAIGLAGGDFADSYNEISGGTFLPNESFIGHGGEISARVYHLFNPADQIPLKPAFQAGCRADVVPPGIAAQNVSPSHFLKSGGLAGTRTLDQCLKRALTTTQNPLFIAIFHFSMDICH